MSLKFKFIYDQLPPLPISIPNRFLPCSPSFCFSFVVTCGRSASRRGGRSVAGRRPDQLERCQVSLPAAPVKVIAVDGSLKEFPASPLAAVSGVLGLGGDAASAPSFFVCNSDALYFNEHPPALAPDDLLWPGQIYFVLPAAMLGRPLSSAELAVCASAALASSSNKARRCGRHQGRSGGRKKKVCVMPVREDQENDVFFNQKLNELTLGEFGLAMSDEKVVSAAARSRLRRALSIIREDAE